MTADENPAPGTKTETAAPKPPSRITIKWVGDRRFDTGREAGPVARLDGDAQTGQSPPEALLSALASCSAVDVVDILAKRRTPVASLEVNVVGEHVDTIPRRFRHITLAFRISGEGIEKAQAERAISLAVTTYCSVRDSLREDIGVDWTLELNGTTEAR
jgi:putative redox protein